MDRQGGIVAFLWQRKKSLVAEDRGLGFRAIIIRRQRGIARVTGPVTGCPAVFRWAVVMRPVCSTGTTIYAAFAYYNIVRHLYGMGVFSVTWKPVPPGQVRGQSAVLRGVIGFHIPAWTRTSRGASGVSRPCVTRRCIHPMPYAPASCRPIRIRTDWLRLP